MNNKEFTPEQYKAEYKRIIKDDRYPPYLKDYLIGKIVKMYKERNNGQEPPEVKENE